MSEMTEERMVLCGANAYEQKYYYNREKFDSLPKELQDELHVICVLYTEEVGKGYVAEFKATADALKPGETSAVITTQYGYHILFCEEATKEKLMNDETFMSKVSEMFPNCSVEAVMEKADELGFEIKSQQLLDEIDSILNPVTEGDVE